MEAGGHFLTLFDMFRPVFILHFQAKLVHAAAKIIYVATGRYPQHLIFAQKEKKTTLEIENCGLYSGGQQHVVQQSWLLLLSH